MKDYKQIREIRDDPAKKGFLVDARENMGFYIEKIEEAKELGFDEIACSVKKVMIGDAFSIKIMKKSKDPNGEFFVYASMKTPICYQYGFFQNMGELEKALNAEEEIQLNDFKDISQYISSARSEIEHYAILNQFDAR